jgi:hypothetical protein
LIDDEVEVRPQILDSMQEFEAQFRAEITVARNFIRQNTDGHGAESDDPQ